MTWVLADLVIEREGELSDGVNDQDFDEFMVLSVNIHNSRRGAPSSKYSPSFPPHTLPPPDNTC